MSCPLPLDAFYGQMHKFLPVGYRFQPTEEELVDDYLRRRIGRNDAGLYIIPEIHNLYNINPCHLPPLFKELSVVRSKEAEWWFLTRLEFKAPSKSKFDRQTSSGHWKTTGKEKTINAKGTKKEIGTMKNLVFTENVGSSRKETVWVMHEYRLKGSNLGANDQNFVLCHLVNRRDEFINKSIAAETASMSPFRSLDNDKARNDIPEVSTNMPCGLLQVQKLDEQNVMEAVMDPCAEASRPPVSPNFPSNPHLVDMGAPSNIDITNDNQSDPLKDLVNTIEEDRPFDKRLDATIPPSNGTESATDNGQMSPEEFMNSLSPLETLNDRVPDYSNTPVFQLQSEEAEGSPENVLEAVMDPCAEALHPPVYPNLPSNPHLVDMGAPSNIDITNDNQSDPLKDLVNTIEEDRPFDERLDATIPPSNGTESATDNGQNVLEAVMDPCAEALHPPVNPNLPSNPHLFGMGTPSNIGITNDNQSDPLQDLVNLTSVEGPIEELLDAIIPPSSGTDSATDNGQGWWSPVNRPVEQGEHADRLKQPTIRPPGKRPRE